ncbi:MAG: hypothetical protein ACPG7F_01515 [Aggregatilineales bacterium]
MSVSREDRQRLIDLLTNHMSAENREIFVRSAFYDTKLLQQIDFRGAPYNFTERLVTIALSYGKLETTGEFAVITLIDEALRYIGAGGVYTAFLELKERLREQLSDEGNAQPVEPASTPSNTSPVSQNRVASSSNRLEILMPTPEPEPKKKNIIERNPVLFTFLGIVVGGLFALGVAAFERGFFDPVPPATPVPTLTPTAKIATDTPQPPSETPGIPTDIPQPSATDTPVSSTNIDSDSTDNDANAVVFIDEESLTVYVPEDAAADLSGVEFLVNNTNNDIETKSLASYSTFAGILSNAEGLCFRLMRSGASSPLAQQCNSSRTITQQLTGADVFWYDSVGGNFRSVRVAEDGALYGICGAGQNRCEITLP